MADEKVKVVFVTIEDFVKRCRKSKVNEMYFRVVADRLPDGRGVLTAELTAIEPGANYLSQLAFSEQRISATPIQNQPDDMAFRNDFQKRIFGGQYEIQKEGGKTEKVDVKGIIPYVQQEFPSCDVINGWIGW